MLTNLSTLSKWLSINNLTTEAAQVNEIIKLSTIKGITSLGFPLEVAKLINKIIGDKWDYQVAKWLLESYGLESIPKEYTGGMSYKDRFINLNKGIELAKKLKATAPDNRMALYKSKEFKSLEDAIYDQFKWSDDSEGRAIWQSEIGEEEAQLDWLVNDFTGKIEKEIEYFIESDFFKDLLDNKSFNKNQCKLMNYGDAIVNYVEKVKIKNMPVVLDLGEYRWVNAGGGLSKYVREKMKNCGRSSYGGLRAVNTDENQMLLLMDKSDNPHVMLTWNPQFVDIYNEERGPRRYIGYIEGIGSSQVKPEYYKHVKDLFDYLKPDATTLHNENWEFVKYLGASQGNVADYPHIYPSEEEKSKLWL